MVRIEKPTRNMMDYAGTGGKRSHRTRASLGSGMSASPPLSMPPLMPPPLQPSTPLMLSRPPPIGLCSSTTTAALSSTQSQTQMQLAALQTRRPRAQSTSQSVALFQSTLSFADAPMSDEPVRPSTPSKTKGRVMPLTKQVKMFSMPTRLELGYKRDQELDAFGEKEQIVHFKIYGDGVIEKVKSHRPSSASHTHHFTTPLSGQLIFYPPTNSMKSEYPQFDPTFKLIPSLCRFLEGKSEQFQGARSCLIILNNMSMVATLMTYLLPSECSVYLGVTHTNLQEMASSVRASSKAGVLVKSVEIPWDEEELMYNNTPDILILNSQDYLKEDSAIDAQMKDLSNTFRKFCGANTKTFMLQSRDIHPQVQQVLQSLESRFIFSHESSCESDSLAQGACFVTTIQRRLTKLPPISAK